MCVSATRGPKKNLGSGKLVKDLGFEGDFHATGGKRQVSILSGESIKKMQGKDLEIAYGDFGENIVVDGLRIHELPIGSLLKVSEVILEVSQIGKECHEPCVIGKTIGDCIMPSEGVFAVVRKGGTMKIGDKITIIS